MAFSMLVLETDPNSVHCSKKYQSRKCCFGNARFNSELLWLRRSQNLVQICESGGLK